MLFSTLLTTLAGLIDLATATPIELGAQASSCDSAWGDFGNNGPVTYGATKQNIDHLNQVKMCKIRARTTLRIACTHGSAIYVSNLEGKDTSYSCNNYMGSATALMNKCAPNHEERFGPAFDEGRLWATILVGDNC